MAMDFQNIDEQAQLCLLAGLDAQYEAAYKAECDMGKALELRGKRKSAAFYIDSDEEVPKYLKDTLENADEVTKGKMRILKPLIEASDAALDELREAEKTLRNSEFESVRETAWADVDKRIGEIEAGRFKGQYLQNVLYALSVGPLASVPGSMAIQFQTGDQEHYNLPDLLYTHFLIPTSGIYGEMGERRNVLTERGQEVLERLTTLHGEPEWAAKIQPDAPSVQSENYDTGGQPA
jgi:hypothetical protein